MDTYLLSIGWWNFLGSIMMMSMVYQPFGQKMLVEWTQMFKEDFILNYWSKLWLFWASGLNIFFGLINILAVHWGYADVKLFLILLDIGIYISFIGLAAWGLKAGRCGSGIYSALVIFIIWITWGYLAIHNG